MNIYLYFCILSLIAFCSALQWTSKQHTSQAIKFTIRAIWIAWGGCITSYAFGSLSGCLSAFGFKIDPLSMIITTLILFISALVHLFSFRYMAGDRCFKSFFLKLTLLTGSIIGFMGSDSIFLCGFFWILNQVLLSLLMAYKTEWTVAKEGGKLFLKWNLIGSLCLIFGMGVLALETKTLSLHQLCTQASQIPYAYKYTAFLLIVFASLAQSGLWPLQGWLMSSLNSPTPVSAFMHAGLVNGGGILLTRFSPLFMKEHSFFQILVALGFVSLVLGAVSKLMQSNVKKMLVCSTLSQMGFMFMQCGLGLFPAAVAHICWHGVFKAFLFLNSGSTLETKKLIEKKYCSGSYIYSFLSCGLGVLTFSATMGIPIFCFNTQALIIVFAAIASFHVSLASFRVTGRLGFMLAPLITILFGFFYGRSLGFVEGLLQPMGLSSHAPLEIFHVVVLGLLLVFIISLNNLPFKWQHTTLWKRIYVKILNWSQSDPKTIMAIRNDYQF